MRKPRKEYPLLAAVLTVVLTAVWGSFPASMVTGYLADDPYPMGDASLMVLRLEWLGLAATTVPAVVLTRITNAFLPRVWRALVILFIGITFVGVLSDPQASDRPAFEPTFDFVLASIVAPIAVCAPAWWFNVIRPLRRRHANRVFQR